ncbi:MAG: hypothetical protein ACXIU7_14830 [Roseinatronobacter sp.]
MKSRSFKSRSRAGGKDGAEARAVLWALVFRVAECDFQRPDHASRIHPGVDDLRDQDALVGAGAVGVEWGLCSGAGAPRVAFRDKSPGSALRHPRSARPQGQAPQG